MERMRIWFSKLKNRIFFSFIGCFLGIMLLIMGVFQISSQTYFSHLAVNSTRRELASIIANLESSLQHVIDYSISVSINQDIINLTKKYPSSPSSEAEQYAVQKNMNMVISTIIGLSPNIAMWDIMAADGSFFHAGGYDLTGLEQFDAEKLKEQHRDHRGALITGPYFYFSTKGKSIENGKYLFLVSKPVVDLNTRKIYAYVTFFIESTSVASPFVNYRQNNSEVSFYITDEENRILLASDTAIIGQNIQKTGAFSGRDVKELEAQGYLTGKGMVYCSTKIKRPAWNLIHVIPMDELMEEQRLFAKLFLFCIFLAMLIFAFLSWWNARAISGPILGLSRVMKNVVKEAYTPVEVPGTSEEIQILYRGYNTLVEQTQQLLQTIYEEEREKNEYQFRLIQEQIKPHFLYNTLEMIKSMIDLGIYEEAGEAITTLARFYRYSLSKGSDIITIGTEIEMVKQYLYIEKLRHMEYFDYEIDCEKDTMQYVIPKLILQPILENAIVHGTASDGRMCFVSLSVQNAEGAIVITVKDDGNGIASEQLHQLNQDLEEAGGKERDSFGLLSINRRVRLLYGTEYGIRLESELGKGTCVVLRIPKLEHLEETVSMILERDEKVAGGSYDEEACHHR